MTTTLADHLRAAMRTTGLSQNEVARRAGVSSATLTYLLRGTKGDGTPVKPRPETLVHVCHVLDLDIRDTFRIAGIPDALADTYVHVPQRALLDLSDLDLEDQATLGRMVKVLREQEKYRDRPGGAD